MNKLDLLYPSLDTPSVLVDMDRLESNIWEMSHLAAESGVKLRPHVKIHQCPEIAKMQISAGACGVEVGTLDQANIMAQDGIRDIMIVHPFYGDRKLEKLRRLIDREGLVLSVVVDMIEQAMDISDLGQTVGIKIPIYLKIDTGINRYGVLPGQPVLDMAAKLCRLPGVNFTGIYAHESDAIPTDFGVSKVALEVGSVMAETAKLLEKEGFQVEAVAVGASATFRATCRYLQHGELTEITEIHPGGCVIGDISYVKSRGVTREACALTVLATVVSTSHPDHVVIDAGLKTFGGDSLISWRGDPDYFWSGKPKFGAIQGRSDLWLGRLGAESGWGYYLYTGVDSVEKLRLGERIEIVPNNATVVINLHDSMYGVRNGEIEREFSIAGRGCGS